jgi:hypothetical protein
MIQQLNSVDQYCCLFHKKHQVTTEFSDSQSAKVWCGAHWQLLCDDGVRPPTHLPTPPAALHRPTAAVLALCATPRPPRCRRTWAAARNDGRDGWGCWWCVVAARAWAQPVIGGDMKQAVHACSPRCRAAGDRCCAPHLSAPPCRLCVCVVACTGDLHFRHHGIVG